MSKLASNSKCQKEGEGRTAGKRHGLSTGEDARGTGRTDETVAPGPRRWIRFSCCSASTVRAEPSGYNMGMTTTTVPQPGSRPGIERMAQRLMSFEIRAENTQNEQKYSLWGLQTK